MSSGICPGDATLGPIVQGCRGQLDFSIKFETIVLTILPASLFIAFSLARITYLLRKPLIVRESCFRFVKIAVAIILATLQLALLIFLARKYHGPVYGFSIAAASLNYAATLVMGTLSALQHSSSPRPSTILNIYLLISLLSDSIVTRSSWLIPSDPAQIISSRIMVASVVVKALCLVLENVPKTRWVEWDVSEHSPEEFSGIFSQGLYLWIHPVLFRGFKKVLSIDDLYPLDRDMTAEKAGAWKPKELRVKKCKEFMLGWDLICHLGLSFLLPVLPRIAQGFFYYCQPYFTQVLLEHLDAPTTSSTIAFGQGLIGVGALVQIGGALSSGLYGYFVSRFNCKLRSCLGAAIYSKLSEGSSGDCDGTEAVTLMNTDVDRVCAGLVLLHEVWAIIIEVAVGLWFLQLELGAAFVVALIATSVCSAAAMSIARHARTHQRSVMSSMQVRVTSTAGVIDNIRSLHMAGITGSITDLVHALRVVEINASVRWLMFTIITTFLGYLPPALTPVITLATTSRKLTVAKIFASLAYLAILCHPLTVLCQLLPTLQAAFTCLMRIRKYLTSEPRHDFRRIVPPSSDIAVEIDGASFGWSSEKMVLTDVKANIPSQQITMLTGPVASGKSTLCKAILGEIPVFTGNLTLSTASSGIGFCDQNPFLTNTTVKKSIIGYSRVDQQRFNEVVWATMLEEDIDLFPSGYDTVVGPNGSMLSGGQKHRISLARALYLDSDIIVVDDIFSALDAGTSTIVFDRIFGPNGIIRRRTITAIVCTNSAHHLRLADHVISLGADGTLISGGLAYQDTKTHRLDTKEKMPPPEEKDKPVLKAEGIFQSNVVVNDVNMDLDESRKKVDLRAYGFYRKKAGLAPLLLLLIAAILFACATNGATYWVTLWTRNVITRPRPFYLGIYALFQCAQLALFLVGGLIAELKIARRSGLGFHKAAIAALISAPLSFFTGTERGVILALFSKDIRIINEEIPGCTARAVTKGVQAAGMAIVIACATPYLLISYPILAMVLYLIQRVFLQTCRQMNLLDLESRSPLNTHFLDTVSGMATIRAFGWAPQNISRNNHLLNNSQRPAYLSAMLQQWLSLNLKMTGAVIGIIVITLAVQLKANPALTGAALVTLTSFSTVLTSFVRSITNLEIRMGSVNRLKKFCEGAPSKHRPEEDFFPETDWPRNGAIEFDRVSASYSKDISPDQPQDAVPLAVNDLTLSIRSGERVAICGRTGSGKSSIILMLLHLLDPIPSCSSNISIDGITLNKIDGTALRRGIIAVPQDPVFLPVGTTTKTNLDPFNEASDEECMAVLAALQLSPLLLQGNTPGAGGLHRELRAETLSAGQQRLFALARAVLRCRLRNRILAAQGHPPGGILLLDEVSFAADENTERIIQEVVQVEFRDYTIIMVSHQLRLVVDFFERVVVMDEGRAVEVGDPMQLKDQEGGRFAQLWNTSEEKWHGSRD